MNLSNLNPEVLPRLLKLFFSLNKQSSVISVVSTSLLAYRCLEKCEFIRGKISEITILCANNVEYDG